jgi:hypothetical protein
MQDLFGNIAVEKSKKSNDYEKRLNHLRHCLYIQELTNIEKHEKNFYINFKQIWQLLVERKQYFKSYETFLNNISEPQLKTRIEELELKLGIRN